MTVVVPDGYAIFSKSDFSAFWTKLYYSINALHFVIHLVISEKYQICFALTFPETEESFECRTLSSDNFALNMLAQS